jgi:phytoene dehydrogenase-like protein
MPPEDVRNFTLQFGSANPMAQGSKTIVIIGGGIAGLCAAVYGQSCGYRVTLLEQHDIPGGLATSWRRGDYTFETCLHWLVGSNPKGNLHRQWMEVFDIGTLSFLQPEEFVRLESEEGGSLTIYSDAERLKAELLKASPADAAEILRFVSAIRRFSEFPIFDMEGGWLRKAAILLRMAPLLPLAVRFSRVSCKEYGQRFKHPLLRRFFTEGATGKMPALVLALSLAWMSQKNAGYPIGGSKAVIAPIAERFRALGGDLRFGAKVETILVENDTAKGVKLTSGEKIMADWVISAADGHATIFEMLGGKYKDSAIERLYSKGETFPSYIQVSLGIGRDLSKEPGHFVRVLPAPLSVDPETSLDAMSFRVFHFDPTFAPAGKTAVTCFLPTYNHAYWDGLRRNDPVRYAAEKHRIAEAVIGVLERRLPGIRENIEEIDVSTPASVARFTGNWKGSMEGWLPLPKTGFGAERQMLPGLKRFLMVGQWVQKGGGLPSGLMTARSAIQSICRQDGVAFAPASPE